MASKKKSTKKKPSSKKAAKKPSTKKAAKKAAKKASTKKAAKKASTKKAAKKASTKKAAKKASTKKAAKKASSKKKAQAGVTILGSRHEPSVFLLIYLPLSIDADERGARFEEPLDDALGELGAVTGGGSTIGDGVVVSCDVEVEVNDIARALPIIRRVLKENDAPIGTAVTRLSSDGNFEVLDEL